MAQAPLLHKVASWPMRSSKIDSTFMLMGWSSVTNTRSDLPSVAMAYKLSASTTALTSIGVALPSGNTAWNREPSPSTLLTCSVPFIS